MTEREKNEICKRYADLITKKQKQIREIWEMEFAIKKLENILIQNKVLKPEEIETIKQYEEYVQTVKYWQSIKKYDGKRKK
jgi:hypothetical protein|nr:MAG TPA: hypothetical protein [Microviridae sp.]